MKKTNNSTTVRTVVNPKTKQKVNVVITTTKIKPPTR